MAFGRSLSCCLMWVLLLETVNTEKIINPSSSILLAEIFFTLTFCCGPRFRMTESASRTLTRLFLLLIHFVLVICEAAPNIRF